MTIQVGCCEDFEPNCKQIDSAFVIDFVHGGKGYTGKPFVFCPWCGKRLEVRSPQGGA